MAKEYVEERSGGLYITGTRVSLASVVLRFQQGASPETILQSFPSLRTLENVYGAIAYYLANQGKVEADLKALALAWEEFEKVADPPPPDFGKHLEGIQG
jgi:uncharacterized protein (DUF433 family)